jgi:hypothetical protein
VGRVRQRNFWTLVGLIALAASTAAQPRPPAAMDLGAVLVRVGERVAEYFARAQSIVCRETVSLQTLNPDLMTDGSRARRLLYDLRIEWLPSADGSDTPVANVLREVVSVDGRRPREKDEPGCMDPKPVTPDPLAMLLPHKQADFSFTWAGFGKVDGRAAVMLDYRSLEKGDVKVTTNKDCLSVEVPGRNRGRVWIDQVTADVLRLDDRLTGMIDFDVPPDRSRGRSRNYMTIERADTSIRYRQMRFQDPEETLLVPTSIDTVTVIRNSGAPRVRKSQRFTDYRRFVTGGRIVQ